MTHYYDNDRIVAVNNKHKGQKYECSDLII